MNNYSVYEHIFPNGKKYIGITSTDPETRWRNGEGYKAQGKIWKAICCYGWENIEHRIIVNGLTSTQAKELEKYLISELDTIENGYNTAMGGDNINTTFLNPHVLFMIRESKRIDKKYGLDQPEDCIVSIAERGKENKYIADIINSADERIECDFTEYKTYSGGGCFMHDLSEVRVDCYWWTMLKLIGGEGKELNGKRAYWRAWLKDYERKQRPQELNTL